MSDISVSMEVEQTPKSLEVPEEPDAEESHSEDDTAADRRCSLTFYTAARHDDSALFYNTGNCAAEPRPATSQGILSLEMTKVSSSVFEMILFYTV
jgi:hypothetical protein